MLKFGIMIMPSAPRGVRFEDRIQECIKEAELAEQYGFDFAMVPEHHQDTGFIPASLLIVAALAARTSRIKIGTAISLIGLKHPMQVVEEFHSLDAISQGRIIAGMGIGYQPQDFSMFGLNVKQRASLFEDALEVLNRARTEDSVTFAGRHAQFEDVTIVPKPVQPDGIPIWIGSWSEAGVRRAARLADGLIIDQHTATSTAAGLLDLYRSTAATTGRRTELTIQRYAAIGDTTEDARAIIEPHVMKTLRYYWRNGAKDASPAWNAAKDAYDLRFDDYEERFIFGTGAECAESLRRTQTEIGINNVLLIIRTASAPTHDVVCDQIRRFGEEVIPQFTSTAGEVALPVLTS